MWHTVTNPQGITPQTWQCDKWPLTHKVDVATLCSHSHNATELLKLFTERPGRDIATTICQHLFNHSHLKMEIRIWMNQWKQGREARSRTSITYFQKQFLCASDWARHFWNCCDIYKVAKVVHGNKSDNHCRVTGQTSIHLCYLLELY